jgi:IclR family transcriptional regulator, KDG regulon repressor
MSESIRAVDRALDVLLCFSIQTPELNMTQISEKVGMHKSTVHRLLATLEKRRFVQRDPVTGIYKPGIRLLQMAYLTLEDINIRQIAIPFMRSLVEQYRETVDLAILDENDVVFVDAIESPQRVKLAASPGQRLPAFSTASGKAILAFMPEKEAKAIREQNNHQFKPFRSLSQIEFFEDLNLTRKRGYSVDMEELEQGIHAVGAPIMGVKGVPIASIAIAGPAYRLARDLMDKIGPKLIATAQEISKEVLMARGVESS